MCIRDRIYPSTIFPDHGPYQPSFPAEGGNTSIWPLKINRFPGWDPFHSAIRFGRPFSAEYSLTVKMCIRDRRMMVFGKKIKDKHR